jgi:hypothetical protein
MMIPHREPGRRRRPSTARLAPLVPVLGLTVLAGCGSSLLGTTSSTGVAASTSSSSSPTTTVPVDGEVAVAFPVIACTSPDGGGVVKSRTGWSPTILVAPIPTSLVGKVTFYTDGTHVLLGPTGWTCSPVSPGTGGSAQGAAPTTASTPVSGGQTGSPAPADGPSSGQSGAIDAQGATTLAVYPSNDPDPPTSGPPTPGAEGIFATYATTGTNAGVDLVCPFFTIPSWQSQRAGCSTTKPLGETTDVLTPDVTQVTDPPGLVGSLAASGGQGSVTGVVLFPQVPSAVSYGSPVAVAAESCSLADASVCPTVLSDFEVREFPVPTTG